MKKFIRQKLREKMIDGQNMSPIIQKFCNQMSIPKEWNNSDYKNTIILLTKMIGQQDGPNAHIWKRLQIPLEQWEQQETSINQQIKTQKMSGDSNLDNNAYWRLIQSTICEQGPDGQ